MAGLLIVQFQINLRIEKHSIELNDRQRNALKSAFMKGFINNQIYRKVNGVPDETSRQELSQHVERGPKKKGKGRSTKYVPTVGDWLAIWT